MSTMKSFSSVEGMNFASKKIETMLHWGLDFCIILHIFTYYYIFLGAFLYFFDLFDVKLIANKRGAPEAPPIHYPINFTSNKSKKYKKAFKNYSATNFATNYATKSAAIFA